MARKLVYTTCRLHSSCVAEVKTRVRVAHGSTSSQPIEKKSQEWETLVQNQNHHRLPMYRLVKRLPHSRMSPLTGA